MAFEHITTKTVTKRSPIIPWTAVIITGSFLVIVFVLAYFQHPLQTWWKNWRASHTKSEVVEIPPILVAQPAITPSPTPLPLPSPTPTPVAATPTPYHAPAQSNSTATGKLPKSGPDDVLVFIASISGVLGSGVVGNQVLNRRRLAAALRKQHIL